MKQVLVSFLLVILFTSVQAQQDYKALLDRFSLQAKNNFKDISGVQTDTASIFYPSILKPDIGEAKIGKYPNTATLNWIIPLAKSTKVQAAAADFIKIAYADTKQYKTISDGTEDEGYITTNVYVLGTEKPLLVFQTIYYRNSEDAEKSNFTIIIYGK